MSEIKRIFEFSVNKEVLVDQENITKDENGNEVKTITKIKKIEPQKFFVRKPNRSLRDQADLYYNVTFSEGIKSGLLSYPLLEKRYSNDGGIFSETQKQKYTELYTKLYQTQAKYHGLVTNIEKTPEIEKEIKDLIAQIVEMQRELRIFELETQSLYNSTAEMRAKKQTVLWYTLFLSYYGDNKPFFGDGKYEEKIKIFDDIEEGEDEFLNRVKSRFYAIVTIWFENNQLKQSDIDNLLKAFEEDEAKAAENAPK